MVTANQNEQRLGSDGRLWWIISPVQDDVLLWGTSADVGVEKRENMIRSMASRTLLTGVEGNGQRFRRDISQIKAKRTHEDGARPQKGSSKGFVPSASRVMSKV